MGNAQYDPKALGRPALNAGRRVGVKKPLEQRQNWAIRFFLDRESSTVPEGALGFGTHGGPAVTPCPPDAP